MSNPSKAKGTAAETAVVTYLRSRGWIHAERRALTGNQDRGDIAGVVGVTIEVKACKAFTPAEWLKEAQTEQANNGDHVGVVIAKRRGTTNPADWYALMTVRQLCDLLAAAGYRDPRLTPVADEEAS